MTSAYPAALDTLSNPSSGTGTADPTLAHSVQHTTVNDAIEAIETKLGIGTGGPPASAAVLRRTATGTSAWGQVTGADIVTGGDIAKRQLNYTAATNVANGVAMSANSNTDVHTAQSFTVDDASSIIAVSVRGTANVTSTTAGAQVSAYLLLDAGSAFLGGTLIPTSGAYVNALSGAGIATFSGLTAGSHTAKVVAICSHTATLYCRPSTFPNFEGLAITVMEQKR